MVKADGVPIDLEGDGKHGWNHAGKTVVKQDQRIQLTKEIRETDLVPAGDRGFFGFERPTERVVLASGEPTGPAVESVDYSKHIGSGDNHRLTVPFTFFPGEGDDINIETQRAAVPESVKLEGGARLHFVYPDTNGSVEWTYLLTDDQLTTYLDISVCGGFGGVTRPSMTEPVRTCECDRE